MKTTKIISACAVLAALASCSNDHELFHQSPTPSDPDVINIVAASSKPLTKAAGTVSELQDRQFADNELINVYLEEIVPGGGSATTEYDMLRYKVTNTDIDGGKRLELVSTPAQDAPHYPISGNGINACAFYPALGTTNAAYDVTTSSRSFSVAEDQSDIADYRKSDLMFGTNNWDTGNGGALIPSFAGTKKPDPVKLYFKHLLSKIIVKLKPGSGLTAPQLKGATVKLYNAYPTATIAPSKTGITVNVANTPAPPATGYTLTTDYASSESPLDPENYAGCAGIIIPQVIDIPSSPTVTKFIEITLSPTYGSAKYVYNIADGDGTSDSKMTFAPGKQYTYNVTLSAGDVVVVSTEIQNWVETVIDGTANLEPAQ